MLYARSPRKEDDNDGNGDDDSDVEYDNDDDDENDDDIDDHNDDYHDDDDDDNYDDDDNDDNDYDDYEGEMFFYTYFLQENGGEIKLFFMYFYIKYHVFSLSNSFYAPPHWIRVERPPVDKT